MFIRFLSSTVLLFSLSACSTPRADEENDPKQKQKFSVAAGAFIDNRGVADRYLGLIHGKAGTERRKIETSRPVAEIVTNVVAKSLKTREMTPEIGVPKWTLSGTIREFNCEQVAAVGISVDLQIKLTKAGSLTPAYSKSFTAEKVAPATTQQEGGDAALQQIASQTLQTAVDRALDDEELRQVLLSE